MPAVSAEKAKSVEKVKSTEGSKPERQGPLPVTVLSGFLGSGKTTLLKHILENANGLRIGVLVNDVAALNIDAKLVANQDKANSLVQLENGCICCTLRDPMMEHLMKLSQDANLDYCIIESTGVAEPAPVAQAFTLTTGEAFDENNNSLGDMPLSAFVKLDTCVTVVDAKNFPDDLETRKKAADRWKDSEDSPEGQRDIAQILGDQLEFADVIIINKCDLITEDEAKRVSSAVRAFNVGATILKAKHSAVSLAEVVGTGKFDEDGMASNTKWLTEMRKEGETEKKQGEAEKKQGNNTKSELEEFGISSFVYIRRKPFHPNRLAGAAVLLADMGTALLRSKGFVWVATKDEGYGEWSQTGAVWNLGPGGKWLIDLPEEEWPCTEPEFIEKAKADMDPKLGDRRQEIVFIGQSLKEKEITEMMDKCLLTDEEMKGGAEKWKDLKDPFEEWDFEEEEEEEMGCGPQCEIEVPVDVPGEDADEDKTKEASADGEVKEAANNEDETSKVTEVAVEGDKPKDESLLGKRESDNAAEKSDDGSKSKRAKTATE